MYLEVLITRAIPGRVESIAVILFGSTADSVAILPIRC